MKITSLRVNNIETPLGFNIFPLSLSWKVQGTGEKQKSVNIIIKKGLEIVFDSGDDTNASSLDYRVDLSLAPRTRYDWTVSVAADNGEQASASSFFETGKMNENWTAQWITPSISKHIQPIISKIFDVQKDITNARMYICGLGVYELYINGKKVGNEFLSPGYHSYDLHLQAQTYDVTDYIAYGKNEIRVWLGDGWFKGRLGFNGGYTDLYGDKIYLIAELHMEFSDGKEEIIATDDSWRCKASPILFSNIYDGEVYDARLENKGGWESVELDEPEACKDLTDRYSLPIVKKESFIPIEIIKTPKDELVLDYGQNLTGWVEFEADIPEGAEIRLTAFEIMQKGCFYHENMRTAKTEFLYISNGKKAYIRPHFTFYGFRYMKVECGFPFSENNFIAYHLRSDLDEIGKIITGNGKVNKLFLNALWSQKDNFLDVPMDCPQRDERLGWTGDAQVFSETACYNMYMPAFYRKYLWDMRAEQSVLEGSVPNVVPRLKEGMVSEHGICPWADAGVIIPWNVYLHYGSKTLLEETYSGMKAWVQFQRNKEEAIAGPHLIKDGFHFADWLALDNDEPGPFGATDPLYIASAYYFRCAQIVSEAAEVLGYYDDAKEYKELADSILSAIQKTYFDEEGICVCETQTAAALSIVLGLSSDKIKEEGTILRKRILDNNNQLNTGFVGTTFLCPALTCSGNHETAVDILLNEDYPGWLYCINLGATTIWERWNSVMPDGSMNEEGMNSLNHYSYGSVVAWMYGYICGIRPSRPGFKQADISPNPDIRLGFAKGTLNTASGTYICEWEYSQDEKLIFHIRIPFDTTATVTLPKGIYTSEKYKCIIKGNNKFNLTAGYYKFIQQ